MDKSIISKLIGEKVKIYPNDTYKKQGIIIGVDDVGVLIEITMANEGCGYFVGQKVFFNHTTKLILGTI